MPREIQLDDVDLERIKMWRKAALKNPIIAVTTEKVDGKIVKSFTRLKELSKPMQRRLKKHMNG